VTADKNDPRLTTQESYLKGVALSWKEWSQPKPDWDHDHCEFCWAKFGPPSLGKDILGAGWTTNDNRHWVCDNCYSDFKDMFDWQ
jgi:hypothetical protein